MNEYAKRRADRIRQEIPILQVLEDYGYQIRLGQDREQQFSCDLHGGLDRKFSARVYPGSNTWHCWACGLHRDAIETVRAKEDLPFHKACHLLERRFKLPPLKFDGPMQEGVVDSIKNAFRTPKRFPEAATSLEATLRTLTTERWFPMPFLLSLWEVYSKICHLVKDQRQVEWTEAQGLVALSKIRGRIEQRLLKKKQERE